MDQQLTIEQFNDLLHEWNGQTVKVTKHELDDIDEVIVDLKTISYSKDTRRIDDYEAMHSLQLEGSGEIQPEVNYAFQPLPFELYEIPIEESTLYEFNGSRFLISTERAVYKIELMNKG